MWRFCVFCNLQKLLQFLITRLGSVKSQFNIFCNRHQAKFSEAYIWGTFTNLPESSFILFLDCRPDLNMSGWLHIHHRAAADLWLPELLVPGLVSVSSLDLVTEAGGGRGELRGGGGLRVRGDKTVNTVTSLSLTTRCRMDLAMFPHDVQVGKNVNPDNRMCLKILNLTSWEMGVSFGTLKVSSYSRVLT